MKIIIKIRNQSKKETRIIKYLEITKKYTNALRRKKFKTNKRHSKLSYIGIYSMLWDWITSYYNNVNLQKNINPMQPI